MSDVSMNDDTDIHFSTAWVLEQVFLEKTKHASDCAYIPNVLREVGERHQQQALDAFSLAQMLGEIELFIEPQDKLGGYLFLEPSLARYSNASYNLTNYKGQLLLWAKPTAHGQLRQPPRA
jgi:hypothetical protein